MRNILAGLCPCTFPGYDFVARSLQGIFDCKKIVGVKLQLTHTQLSLWQCGLGGQSAQDLHGCNIFVIFDHIPSKSLSPVDKKLHKLCGVLVPRRPFGVLDGQVERRLTQLVRDVHLPVMHIDQVGGGGGGGGGGVCVDQVDAKKPIIQSILIFLPLLHI